MSKRLGNMANTSSRTLRLLSLLQTHRYWSGDELAARLEVSIRTLRRDVDRLRELGYPVQAQRGVDGGYQLAPGAALPPLVLDDDEAVALAVGLRAATQGAAVAGIAESSVRALAKVIQVMPPRLRRRVEALHAMTVSSGWGGAAAPVAEPDTLVVVAQACRDAERIEFEYTAASGEHTQRQVEPLRLVSLGRRWYLVGYDLTRHDWRSFRLDRLGRPHNTGARFRPRELPAEDAATFVRNGIGTAPVSYDVEVTVHAPAASVRSVIGRWAEVEPAGDERCVVRMRTDSLDWAAMAMGAVGADFTVHSPSELHAHLRDWGRRFSRAATTVIAERVKP
jgi:predicted DNA-binding transcriptional regulator YafY